MKFDRRRIVTVLAVLAGWSIMAVLFTPQHYVLSRQIPDPPHWSRLLLGNLAMFLVWAMLTPLILWFGRRFPLERGRLVRNSVMHFAAGFAFSLLHIGGVRYVNALITGSPPRPWFDFLVGYGATGILIAWALLAASQALTYFRRYQDRELRLVQAKLQSLKTQLHPHFLFNTLNAIAELIHVDASRAERTLTQLSDLLRTALNRGEADEVTLKEELDFLRNYVDIQQTLLQERLTVRWQIDDETLDACVPAMLLQPIVENAIQHGIGPIAAGGLLEISSRRDGDEVHIVVQDDGRGLGQDVSGGRGKAGIGLANTRMRLSHMYGAAHRFALDRRAGGGVKVTITMPFKTGFEIRAEPGDEND
ncbi:MAG: histidine kinase [Acidobacteriota bacterium]|nr:histidine kinase [Acidobacteriota bacterium]